MAQAGTAAWNRLLTKRVKYPRSVTTCDQATFSTAIQQLRAEGVPFRACLIPTMPADCTAKRAGCVWMT